MPSGKKNSFTKPQGLIYLRRVRDIINDYQIGLQYIFQKLSKEHLYFRFFYYYHLGQCHAVCFSICWFEIKAVMCMFVLLTPLMSAHVITQFGRGLWSYTHITGALHVYTLIFQRAVGTRTFVFTSGGKWERIHKKSVLSVNAQCFTQNETIWGAKL